MSDERKYPRPKWEEPEMIEWEDNYDSEYDYNNDRIVGCYPTGTPCRPNCAPTCRPRYCRPYCAPTCQPRYCRPRCRPLCFPTTCYPRCRPRLCNPNCFPY